MSRALRERPDPSAALPDRKEPREYRDLKVFKGFVELLVPRALKVQLVTSALRVL